MGVFGAFLTVGAMRVTETAAENGGNIPIYSVETDKKEIAVTFDVAWQTKDLPEILSALRAYHAPSTFFMVGDFMDKYPDAVRAIYDAGHELAAHSEHHGMYSAMTGEELLADMENMDARLRVYTGEEKHLVRAPSGDYTSEAVETCRRSGREIVQWDVDSLDWKDVTYEEIKKRILSKTKNGSILLFHVGTRHTGEALPDILDALQKEGYTFVTVSDLIACEDYSLDASGVMHKK